MSYILTAIKQAERERQRGKTPDVLTTPADRPRPSPRKPPWLWLGVALLANAAIVALVWLWPESPPIPVESRAGPSERPVPEPTGRGEVRSTPGLLSSTSPPRPQRIPAPVSVPEDAVAPESESFPRPAVPVARAELPVAKTKPARLPGVVTPGRRTATAEPAPPAVESPPVATTGLRAPATRPKAVEPNLTAGSAARTVTSGDGAAIETLKRLPDLKINVHVWNDDPRQRFVLINMRKYYEGTRLAKDGSLLEKITSDGVILVRDDKRIHLLHGF